jgi:hypothetical protein
MNQMRGFLLERGITMRKGPSHLAAQLQSFLEKAIAPSQGGHKVCFWS